MITHFVGNITTSNLSAVLHFVKTKYLMLEQSEENLVFEDMNVIRRGYFSEFSEKKQAIKSKIAQQRRKFDIVVVEPKSADLAAFIARDNRVDMVRINPNLGLRIFNTRYSRRLAENNTIVELDLSFFHGTKYGSELRQLRRILKTFEKSELAYFLTNSPQKLSNICSYRGLQSFGRLLGLSNRLTASTHVINRFLLNRKKLAGDIPFPGVEIDGS